ncbi:MAG: hypothetical protein M3442_13880 [Chloroflexota bacterium]|nr:hypothetical protein [Chloroflexota bacterium]
MRRRLYENGLSLVMFALFAITLAGQSFAGLAVYNQEQEEHGGDMLGYASYLASPHFVEAVFENWESEFLQMAAYVVLTVVLRQKGSPESKKLKGEGEEDVDADPREHQGDKDAPWPVRQGGFVLTVYQHSLSLTLLLFFVVSFALHAAGGAREYGEEQSQHGGQPLTSTLAYVGTSRFWFESLQNWQSEFLSVGLLVVLSVYLRQRGSPESKPVHGRHSETGRE